MNLLTAAFTATLSAQVVPAGIAPPAAIEAGFTTLAFDGDFTKTLPKNWLGGCPNGPDGSTTDKNDNVGHTWYNGIWWNGQAASCNAKQVADPSYGGTVLDLPWLVHYQGGAGGDGYAIETAAWNWPTPDGQGKNPSIGFGAPNNAYYEIVLRGEPRDDSAISSMITWATTGIAGGDAGIEWDIAEMGGNGGGNGAIHNWGTGGGGGWMWTTFNAFGTGNDILNADPSYDPAKYNAFGLRTTSDGSNNIHWCAYINDHLIRCGDLAISDVQKNQLLFLVAGTSCYWGNYNNSCPLEGKMQHTYIKTIRVYSCASWARTECNNGQ